MRRAVSSLLAEPRVPDPPQTGWRDAALLGVLATLGIVEAILAVELAWLPVALITGVAPMATLLWRRKRPTIMAAIAFGVPTLVALSTLFGVEDLVLLYANLYVLLISYAAFRWGSGREAMAVVLIMMGAQVVTESVLLTGPSDFEIGAALYLFPAALGTSVRYRTGSRLRETEKIQLLEREILARELHDTVAHHVTAIAVQAEAGLARAEAGQDSSIDSLEAIKLAASRALTEMRVMVGVLRQAEEPDLSPQPGLADLERLASDADGRLPVDLAVAEGLGTLPPPVGAAVYRIAQESITNAVRHARRATRIRVSVGGSERHHVKIVISDDGVVDRIDGSPMGYGLVGMLERVTLLGGTLEAGPGPGAGWTVTATLPTAGCDGPRGEG